MASVVRKNDPNVCGGIVMTGMPTVRVNGLPVAVNNAPVTPHTNFEAPHTQARTSATKNKTVRAGGIAIVVSTDQDSCNHPRGIGSPNVRIG
jgi:uncharacterized Zn-binding protein involved in type VI secretion